jgi:3' terminal RNA ribose 2'-O-methyltransferase Hen1
VLDDEKHYWIGDDEVAKLLRHGEGWLARHPERELIARRYLKHQRSLTDAALAQLADEDDADRDATDAQGGEAEDTLEASIGLQHQRLEAVLAALHDRGVPRVLDLGCGHGTLVRVLLRDSRITEVVGMDVARRQLDRAAERWRIDEWPPQQRQRLKLIQGSLLYRDTRLVGYDAAVLIEVIEHLEPTRLETFARVIFGYTRPGMVILTTPNQEYNVQWPRLQAGGFRHRDHRFEWTRAEFQQWATVVAQQCGYTVDFQAVGPQDPHVGSPTQMGIFTRCR